MAPWRRVVAPLVAIVPGVLVHGAGSWVLGHGDTARRLLLLEGSALIATFVGGAALATTGASRFTVAPAALLAAAGVSGFGASFAASLYASIAPERGFGRGPRRLPLLTTEVGYVHLQDPDFAVAHLLQTSVDARLGRYRLAASGEFAPGQGSQRIRLGAGYRFLGPAGPGEPSAADGSFLEATGGFGEHRYDSEGFVLRTAELQLAGRLDSQRYLPRVHGAFFQLGGGYARQWVSFDVPGAEATQATSLLLMRMGFGVYLGRGGGARQTGGEAEIYYDHRHDGYVGGLKNRGLGSGAAGHFGLAARYQLTAALGVRAYTEVGSAWAFGLGLVLRTGGLR